MFPFLASQEYDECITKRLRPSLETTRKKSSHLSVAPGIISTVYWELPNSNRKVAGVDQKIIGTPLKIMDGADKKLMNAPRKC